jgi:Fe-S-cluster containining protein
MEIAIDLELVRRLLKQEYATAHDELVKVGPEAAYERSQQRHDERLAAAADADTLACSAGCSWCCHFTVDVRPIEALRIVDFIDREFTPEHRAQVRRAIEANRAALSGLDEVERMQRNITCPFLEAGRCTIYAARPQTCRNYHATDAAGCQRSYEEPDNLDIDPEFAPLTYQTGGAHVEAFSKAMDDAGYDVAAYEMSALLAVALDHTQPFRERVLKGVQAWPGVKGMDAPFELSEAASEDE